ncbi:hypothetical protein DVK02_00350 [Halobellus sp. Atlit-31R]|nr:hypothetical protein DVK02_00350 [Halobellus sp. Atlit-31R]
MRFSVVGGLRQPDRIGEHRCWPCTTVNVAVLLVCTAVVWTVSAFAALAAAVAGLFVIWMRGYLVPGTPRFAPQLVARLPGGEALFHGRTEERDETQDPDDDPTDVRTADDSTDTAVRDGQADGPVGEELLQRLVDAGVLYVDGGTVSPTAAFEKRWHAEMAKLREEATEELADAALRVSPASDAHAVRQDGREWVALSAGADSALEETWLTRPIAVAEVAGAHAAAAFVDDETALAAAQTCRLFLDDCPDCGTALERGTDASCCGGYRGPGGVPAETLFCPSCEARVYTFD